MKPEFNKSGRLCRFAIEVYHCINFVCAAHEYVAATSRSCPPLYSIKAAEHSFSRICILTSL